MKALLKYTLFAAVLLYSMPLCAQQNTGVIKVRKKSSNLICLNGYTDGYIQPHLLCGGKGLFVTNSDRYKIKSCVVLVETVKEIEVRITGNVIAGDICETFDRLKTGDIVYINKIIAIDNSTGREVNMPPLKFEVRNGPKNDKKQRYDMLED